MENNINNKKDKLLSQIFGICYSGFRDGQNPITKVFPTKKEIEEDFLLLKNCKNLRFYSFQTPDDLPTIANQYKINAYPTIWIDRNKIANGNEIKKALKSVAINNNIKAINVGSTPIGRKFISVEALIEYIKIIKKQVNIPVSTSETWQYWMDNPDLVKNVDFIGLHNFAYHSGIKIEHAFEFIDSQINALRKKYPDKEIHLYDNGWSTYGESIGNAHASVKNQKIYLKSLIAYGKKTKIPYFFFEAFDEDWKKMREGERGAHYGLFTTDRKFKH